MFIITNGSPHFVDIITVGVIIAKLLIIQLPTFHYGLIAHTSKQTQWHSVLEQSQSVFLSK
jgi:hypothetical protein